MALSGCGDDEEETSTGSSTSTEASSGTTDTTTTTATTSGSTSETSDSSTTSTSGSTGDSSSDGTDTTDTTATTATTGDSTTSDGTTGGSTGEAITIPDPGVGTDEWMSTGEIGTPQTAWPVGVATQATPYMEGTADANGNAFFVFEAGPSLTQITLEAFGTTADHAGLHDGAGGLFGAEITAVSTGAAGGTWDVTPGQVYVFHLELAATEFF